MEAKEQKRRKEKRGGGGGGSGETQGGRDLTLVAWPGVSMKEPHSLPFPLSLSLNSQSVSRAASRHMSKDNRGRRDNKAWELQQCFTFL